MRYWVRFSPTTNNYYTRNRTWRANIAAAHVWTLAEKQQAKFPPGNERTIWREIEMRDGERVVVS